MTYEEFTQKLEKHLNQIFQEGGQYEKAVMAGRNIQVILPQNERSSSITIQYHLEYLYSKYGSLPEPDAIRNACTDIYKTLQSREITGYQSLSEKLSDYDQIQDRMFVYLGGKQQDLNRLHKTVKGAEGIFKFVAVGTLDREETAFFPITHRLLQKWGVSETDVWAQAEQNTRRLYPVQKIPLAAAAGITAEEAVGEKIQVVTNKVRVYGAAALFYPGVMEESGKELGNYYLLPASVHEWILFPEAFGSTAAALEEMVRDINRKVVPANEVLSDHVYHYDNRTKRLERADAYEQKRKKAKEKTVKPPQLTR